MPAISPPPSAWYDAVARRHSYRTYDGRAVEPDKLARLTQTCLEFSRPQARLALSGTGGADVFRGIAGSYGKVTGAGAWVAVIVDTTLPECMPWAGYVGEGIILEAVTLGLATCWVGGFFRPGRVTEYIELKPGEKVMAITPVGYATASLSATDRALKRLAGSHKRLKLDELATGLPRADWPEWVTVALQAARLAPSAVNRQPWRFEVQADAITIGIESDSDTHRIPMRLDCGIAMLHLELGAGRAGVSGRWEFLQLPRVARFITGENGAEG
ncbi:MAG: nitroreductase family protein [Thermoleophilia bacterium]